MVLTANERVREKLNRHPDVKFGFVIYRCTYKSDDDWNKFMEWLNLHTQYKLEQEGIGELYSRLDWNVQEDPTLQDAEDEYVREKFRTWLAETDEKFQAFPRHRACIAVHESDLDMFLRKCPMPPDQHDLYGTLSLTLISCRDEKDHGDEDETEDEEEWESFDPNTFDPNKTPEPNEDSDEEYVEPPPPRDRVSSIDVSVSSLLPRAWSLLDGPGWQGVKFDNRDLFS